MKSEVIESDTMPLAYELPEWRVNLGLLFSALACGILFRALVAGGSDVVVYLLGVLAVVYVTARIKERVRWRKAMKELRRELDESGG